MSGKVPNIIISTKVGSKTKYVLNAPMGADKRRWPVLVDDLEKAKRFWSTTDAHNYITFFANTKGRMYAIEKYQAVTAG